jgi:hypothetical protein
MENKTLEELSEIYFQMTGNKSLVKDKKKLLDLIQKQSTIRPTVKSTIGNVKTTTRELQLSPPRRSPPPTYNVLPDDLLVEKLERLEVTPKKDVTFKETRVSTQQPSSNLLNDIRSSVRSAPSFNPSASYARISEAPQVVSKDLMKVSLPTSKVSSGIIQNIKQFINQLPVSSMETEVVEAAPITKRMTPKKKLQKVVEEEPVKKKTEIMIEPITPKKLPILKKKVTIVQEEPIEEKGIPIDPRDFAKAEQEFLDELEAPLPPKPRLSPPRITKKIVEEEPPKPRLSPPRITKKIVEEEQPKPIIILDEEEEVPKKIVKKKISEEPKKLSATKKKVVEEVVTPVKKTSARKTPVREGSVFSGMTKEEVLNTLKDDYLKGKMSEERSKAKDTYTVEKMKDALTSLEVKTTGLKKAGLLQEIKNILKEENLIQE